MAEFIVVIPALMKNIPDPIKQRNLSISIMPADK